MIVLFSSAADSIGHAVADISDGDQGPAGDAMIACAVEPDALLVPDWEFYGTKGYAAVRRHAATKPISWAKRDPTIVWRGSTTGAGTVASDAMGPEQTELIQRTRMCLLLRGQSGIDAKFATVVQDATRELARAQLKAARIFGERIDALSWDARKFAIDIDGNSNAWSNLFTRLLLGCCVIKIGSKLGFRQWYYDGLRPWEHFVPVAPDMTDLIEKIEWCRTHEQACKEIAGNGQRFAMRRTYETEMQDAVERIERRLGSARA
jgi:hypothetical protein